MKKKKLFLTDCDNAIMDWTQAMIDYLKEVHPHLKIIENDYSFGLESDLMDVLWRDFNNTDRFIDIKPLRDAQVFLPKIAALGYEFVAITSCYPDDNKLTNIEVKKRRIANLEKYFPGCFVKTHCLQVHDSKLPVLKLYSPTFWIDDKLNHILSGIEAGHKSILMDHDYNRNCDISSAVRVTTWKEIYNIVKSEQ